MGDPQSFTHTPVVFGVPETMAKALGYPGKPIGIGDLGLDDATAAAESPLFHLPAAHVDLHGWVGADERPVFLRQSRLIADAWAGMPRTTRLTVEPGRHHMDVIAGLTEAEHPLTEALVGGI